MCRGGVFCFCPCRAYHSGHYPPRVSAHVVRLALGLGLLGFQPEQVARGEKRSLRALKSLGSLRSRAGGSRTLGDMPRTAVVLCTLYSKNCTLYSVICTLSSTSPPASPTLQIGQDCAGRHLLLRGGLRGQ